MKSKTIKNSNNKSSLPNDRTRPFICHICGKELSSDLIKVHLLKEHLFGINECVLVQVVESVRDQYIRSYYITMPVSTTLQTIEKFLIDFQAFKAMPLGQFYYTSREALPWNKDIFDEKDYVLKKSCHIGDPLPSRTIMYDFGFRTPNDIQPVIIVCNLHILQTVRRDRLRPSVKIMACDFSDDCHYDIRVNSLGTAEIIYDARTKTARATDPDSIHSISDEELTGLISAVSDSSMRKDRGSLIKHLSLYLCAAANLYGVINFRDFKKLIMNYRNINIDEKMYIDMQSARPRLLSKKSIEGDLFVYPEVLNTSFDPNVLGEIFKTVLRERTEKSMRLLPEIDFLRYIDSCYLKRTHHVDAFCSLFKNKVSMLGFDNIYEIVYHFKILSQVFIIDQNPLIAFVTQTQGGEPIWSQNEIRHVLSIIFNTYHEVPLWSNYGWTPLEMRPLRASPPPKADIQFSDICVSCMDDKTNDKQSSDISFDHTFSKAKVGRNEPCPCGSGKKYKHCHGKN